MKQNNKKKITEKDILKLLDRFDWKGMAEAYHESQNSWNAENWKHFVETIRNNQKKELREKVMREKNPWEIGTYECGTWELARHQILKLL